MYGGEARFDYNWTWYSQYQASTYGVRVISPTLNSTLPEPDECVG